MTSFQKKLFVGFSKLFRFLLYSGIVILLILGVYEGYVIFRNHQLRHNSIVVNGIATQKLQESKFDLEDPGQSPPIRFTIMIDIELSYSYIYNGEQYSGSVGGRNFDITHVDIGDSLNVRCSMLMPSISDLPDLKI